MAKAHFKTKEGTEVTIEGTAEEVSALLSRLEMTKHEGAPRSEKRPQSGVKAKTTPANLVAELIDGGFFKKPKELGAIKTALEEHGHFYPVTTLSPLLLRLVRKKELRRIKDQKRWLYVGH